MSFTIKRPIEDRFWEKVNRRDDDECWEWMGATNALGYGSFFVEKVGGVIRTSLAHRMGYQLEVGQIPAGALVLHSCDNPPCVNPAHLSLGTNLDNAADRESRGRGGQPKGSRSGNAKLTEADIREIRDLYPFMTQDDLAMRFGVCQTTISRIVLGKSWSHVEGAA